MRLAVFLFPVVAMFVIICVGFTSAENVLFVKNVDNQFRRLRVPDHEQEERGAGDAIAKAISSLHGGDDAMATKLSKIFANSNSALKLTDDEVAKMSILVKKANAGDGIGLTDDEVAKFAIAFASAQKSAKLTDDQVFKLSKMIADQTKVKEAAKVSDDEVAKASEIFKKAMAEATGGAMLADDELVKMGKAFAAAQKGAGLNDDQVSKLSKMFSGADFADDALKITDDEAAKTFELVKKANAGDGVGLNDGEVAALAIAFASAQKTVQLTDDQVFKLSKMIADQMKVKEAAKVSDDEVAKVSEIFKKANAGATGEVKYTDAELAMFGKSFAAAQKGASLSDEQVGNLAKLFAGVKQATTTSDENVAKLSQELVVVAQKDKKSWSTLKKVIVGTLGVSVGGAVIYATAKLANHLRLLHLLRQLRIQPRHRSISHILVISGIIHEGG